MPGSVRSFRKAQSVTEYLSTYSWAILAAAVIVGIMFALGIFSSPIPIQSCILVPGYVCSHPILTDSGVLTFNLSYIGQTIAVTGIGCNSGTLPPTTLQNVNFILTSNKGRSITVSCPISSNAFGTAFQGHLWLQYNTQTQSGLVSDIGVILGAVNTRTSTSTTSTSTTSTSSTSSTSTSTSSTTSSTSTSTSTTTSTSSSTSSSTSTSTSTTSSTSSTSLTTTIHYMYCQLSGTRFYYAPILSGGALGSWTATTPYPSAYGDSPICVSYNGYIYCEGGYAALGYTSPAEYYAPYSAAGGLGAWKLGYNSTLAGGVPLNLDPSPCAVYNNYIECGPTDNPA
ncbi:MAG: hypothetical protein KGH78_03370, partial [Candidatus Micrarchaeota archaeon]|nr:hypothetical protein [Candidatus Micrarchaeota archaeon]